VKLLLDHNLSHKIAIRLADVYPESTQTRLLNFGRTGDSELWFYARTHGYIVVTKDRDIAELAVLRGAPPKVVWLRIGNCSANAVESMLRRSYDAIAELIVDKDRIVLELVE
jgi:predicted nuclease of predicted toxin-antitoxin system